ncbi:hypothetical protein HDU83_008862 [Entophlyctis luteolus]|nr:hypothetical protein HDU83_008862 [Entophlyctis luteolus]
MTHDPRAPHDAHGAFDAADADEGANPFYPLRGPPQTPQERDLLNGLIAAEKAASGAAVRRKAQAHTDIRDEARANCADLAFDVMSCMRKHSILSLFYPACAAEQRRADECIVTQMKLLRRVGFEKAKTDNERLRLSIVADKLYLAESTQTPKSE